MALLMGSLGIGAIGGVVVQLVGCGGDDGGGVVMMMVGGGW